VVVEIFAVRGEPVTIVALRLAEPAPAARLTLRPLLSGRDLHASQHENAAFAFAPEPRGRALRFAPYPSVPAVLSLANGEYQHAPDWYRNFFYAEEAARGLDALEDLASPGVLSFDLAAGEAVWVLSAEVPGRPPLEQEDAAVFVEERRKRERARRLGFEGALERAAADYVVARGGGRTIIAGYPWFGDWGRDTFIALRGLCFATGDFRTAAAILDEWAWLVSDGMLPNRFVDAGGAAEYNSVDAALWFVLAADELLNAEAARGTLGAATRTRLEGAILEIVAGYSAGTRHGIRRDDEDGLLRAGEAGQALTWMDAKVEAWVATPRRGKPVEVQALWVHALLAASRLDARYAPSAAGAQAALEARFWNDERKMLFDVIDVEHVPGTVDAACRPNQIFAAGGLPVTLLTPERAWAVVSAVERELWTPLGLRTLARGEPGYAPRYAGGVRERDGAYHQGTVWPWLAGPFVEAWVKAHGGTRAAKVVARARFVTPLLAHLRAAGLGHVSEVADGDAPHRPGGCPFQAWSLGELLRLERSVLAS
jgi:predicted glycogen debranching enzyme